MATLPAKVLVAIFGKARRVQCHAVSGSYSAGLANEMFSDFLQRDIGVPQLAPTFGVGKGNRIFDGPGEDEDFGREEFTGDPTDRYLFRTAPPRNLTRQPMLPNFGNAHAAARFSTR